MPYRDREKARDYYRRYRQTRRSGDTRSTPVQPAQTLEFRLETAAEVIALLEDQVRAVLEDEAVGTVDRARCVGYLAGVSLRAIEAGNLAARVEELEAVLKRRSETEKK